MFYGLGVVYHPVTTPLLFSFGVGGGGYIHVQLSKNSVPNGGWDERMCVEKILRPLGGMFRAKSDVPTWLPGWCPLPPKVLNKFLNCLIDNFVLWE